MIKVQLHGAYKDKMPRGHKGQHSVYATTVREVIQYLQQFYDIRDFMNTVPAEIRIGTSWKKSTSLTAEQVAAWQVPSGATIHIGPHAGGHEITTAMLVTALVSAAISIGVTILMSILFPMEQDNEGKTRKNALFENGLNTQKENVPLPYLAGDRIFAGFNAIETNVDYTGSGGDYVSLASLMAAKAGGTGASYASQDWQLNDTLAGAKGGGKTIDDTTSSNATGSVLGALGGGEIGGIVGDTIEEKEKHIIIGQVPLRDPGTNTLNWKGVTWAERYGIAGQSLVGLTPGISSNFNNSVELKHTDGQNGNAAAPHVENVSPGVDWIKVRIRYNQLVSTSSKGNQSATSVAIGCDVKRVSASSWTPLAPWNTYEKSSQAFERQYRVNAPPKTPGNDSDPWMFRVYRITPDSDDDKLQNSTNFSGWVEVQDRDLPYDGSDGGVPTALFGISLALDQFAAGSDPEIAVILRGQKVRVPSNYDPVTRVYTGTWTGAWKYAVTSNPVWHWLELATNPLMGCGIPDTFFNKFSLYQTARYCDDDVNGRPRFTLNKQFTDQTDGWQQLIDLGQTFRAFPYFNGAEVVLHQDRPQNGVDHYINNSASLNGLFAYDMVPVGERTNEYKVTFDDPDAYYKLSSVTYRDEEAIDHLKGLPLGGNGVISKTVHKLGCTSRQEAFDWARILTFCAQKEHTSVTFNTMIAAAGYAPGQLIEIDDWTLSGKSKVGRVVEVADGTATLDAAVTLKANTTYSAHMVVNNRLVKRPIVQVSQDTTTDTIQVDTTDLDEFTPMGIVEAGGVQPRVFRISDIQEQEQGIYQITAQLHVEGKYAWLDNSVPVVYDPWTQLNPVTPRPTDMTFTPNSWEDDILGTRHEIDVNWPSVGVTTGVQYGSGPMLAGYVLRVKRPGRNWEEVYRGGNTFATIQDVTLGTHFFSLTSINTLGRESDVLIKQYDFAYSSEDEVYPPVFVRFN